MSKNKNKAKPIIIEQNIPVDPPQSFERPEEEVEKVVQGLVTKQVDDAMINKNQDEIVEKLTEVPVIATPRDAIIFKIKALAHDIEKLEPRSGPWCEMLEKIGDLKRELDKLK